MLYTRAIYFKDGKNLTITESEAKAITERMISGDKFVVVQGELISADTIARVGSHSSTADLKKYERAQIETQLKLDGKGYLVERRKELEKKIAIENIGKERVMIGEEYENWMENNKPKELISKKQNNDEAMDGEPMFYIDKQTGEKMYS